MKSDTKPQQQIGQSHRKIFHSIFLVPFPHPNTARHGISDEHNFMRLLASLKSAPS